MLTVVDEYSRECRPYALSTNRTKRRFLRPYSIFFCYTDHRNTSGRTMARSSPQRLYASGQINSTHKHYASSRVVLGKTATTRVLTANYAMNCLTAKSSLRCKERKYSWNNGTSVTSMFHTAPHRYVVDKSRLCCRSAGIAGLICRRRARTTNVVAASLYNTSRLNTQGPSFKGCSASMSPRSTAKRRVLGLMFRRAAARVRFIRPSDCCLLGL